MIDDELHAQAALYALDALPPEEAAAFRARLSEVPGLSELVAEYEDAAAVVAETAPGMTPPPALRRRILASIAKKPEVAESRRIVWLPWALAAGFAFAAGALWVENQRLTIENNGQRTAWVYVSRQLARMNESGAEKDLLLGNLSQQFAVATKASAEKDQLAETLRGQIAELARRSSLAETQVADRKSTRLNSSHTVLSRMPSSA